MDEEVWVREFDRERDTSRAGHSRDVRYRSALKSADYSGKEVAYREVWNRGNMFSKYDVTQVFGYVQERSGDRWRLEQVPGNDREELSDFMKELTGSEEVSFKDELYE